MARLTIAASILLSTLIGPAALAQGAAPIANQDVVGNWTLVMTPVERQDMSVTFKARDGSQRISQSLTITAGPNGRLTCRIDADPAECRIRDGRLIIVAAVDSARMTYTLSDRTRGGFSGSAGMRLRLLPIGGQIGVVTMMRP